MLGSGSPTRTFAPLRPAADEAAAYSRAEFRDGSAEWLVADAARASAERPGGDATTGGAPHSKQASRGRALTRWVAWASAVASRFAGVFL
jgi:hypothetical protein